MKYKEVGNGLNSLYQFLATDMNRKRILEHDYSDIKIKKVGDDILWQIYHKCETSTTGKKYSGKTLKKFQNRLNSLYENQVAKTVPDVCALLDITDGIATYVVASTEVNSKGNFEFRKIKLEVTPYEQGICFETRLALWDETYLYPFTTVSVQGAGNLLDSNASFKTIAEIPLGAALLLSEKIESRRNLDIMYDNNETKLFYEKSHLSWKMEANVITLDIPLCGLGLIGLDYVPIIRLSTSHMPGSSNKAELIAKVGDGYVLLMKQKKYHNNMDLSDFLDGFKEEIDKFNLVVKNDIFVHKDELSDLRKIVGDKRFNTYTVVNKTCSIEEFISDTWRELPPKQYYMLMEFYRDYIYKKSKELDKSA